MSKQQVYISTSENFKDPIDGQIRIMQKERAIPREQFFWLFPIVFLTYENTSLIKERQYKLIRPTNVNNWYP